MSMLVTMKDLYLAINDVTLQVLPLIFSEALQTLTESLHTKLVQMLSSPPSLHRNTDPKPQQPPSIQPITSYGLLKGGGASGPTWCVLTIIFFHSLYQEFYWYFFSFFFFRIGIKLKVCQLSKISSKVSFSLHNTRKAGSKSDSTTQTSEKATGIQTSVLQIKTVDRFMKTCRLV